MPKEGTNLQDTFWNRLRAKSGWSYKDLAETLGKSRSTVAQWFTGAIMPPRNSIQTLCELFGITYQEGYEGFADAHRAYSPQYGRAKSETIPEEQTTAHFTPRDVGDPSTIATTKQKVSAAETDANASILKSIYGVLSYEDYEAVRRALLENKDPLAIIYNKVSYEQFMSIRSSILSVNSGNTGGANV